MGVGIKEDKSYREKIVYIFGTWKFSRSLGLLFQVDYGKGKIKEIEFGADLSFSDKDKISFNLLNDLHKPLGISLTLSRKFLKENEAEVFVRLEKKLNDLGIEAGLRVPF
ncbi:MAG: hypothetical protein PHO70_00170 [Candidatus Omnitrophica bacterium]|nr:hypothetical protein [Candidatus Omnitrophota bacterium]